jgi:hypothetical protein
VPPARDMMSRRAQEHAELDLARGRHGASRLFSIGSFVG